MELDERIAEIIRSSCRANSESLAALSANAVGNLALIPVMGAEGVAVASLASYGGLALVATTIAVIRFNLLGRSR